MTLSALTALTLSGCVKTLDVALPELPAGDAFLLVFAEDGRPVAAYADDAEEGGAPPLALTLGDDTEVYALVYACPLGQLSLRHGWQALEDRERFVAPEGESLQHLVRTPPASWAPLSVRPAWLVRPEPRTCSTFRATHVRLPGADGQNTALFVALDPEHVLVGLRDPLGQDSTWIVTSTSAQPMALPEGTPSRGAWRSPDGTLVLVGRDGRIARGTRAAGFTVTATIPPTRAGPQIARAWTIGQGAREGDERVVLTAAGTLDRWDGAAWTRLGDFDVCPFSRACDQGSLLRRPDGEVLAALQPVQGQLLRVKGGALTAEPFAPTGRPSSITALAESEVWGLVAGTGSAGLYQRTGDGAWSTLDGAEAARVNGLVLDGDRLYCACGPLLTEYVLGHGRCAEEALPIIIDFRHLVELGRASPDGPLRLAAMPGGADQPAEVVFVEVERPKVSSCPAQATRAARTSRTPAPRAAPR